MIVLSEYCCNFVSLRQQQFVIMIRYKLLKAQLTGTIYPQQVESQPFTQDDMNEVLKKRFGSIAPAVLSEAVRIISEKLSDGNTVAIDGLGTFSVRLGMANDGVTDFKEVRTQDITVNGVRFNACKELRRNLGDVDIHVQKGSAIRREITTEQRWVMLYDHMLQELNSTGYATTNATSFKQLTGCTGYTARKELEQFATEGKLQRIPARRVKLYTLSQEILSSL